MNKTMEQPKVQTKEQTKERILSKTDIAVAVYDNHTQASPP